jgi:hypothetical protein
MTQTSGKPRDFRQRDPTRWLYAILIVLCAVSALVVMNRYL